MTYQEAIDFLYSQLPMYQRVGKAAIKKDLTNTIQLCSLLDNPQNKFKSIHIAGTNGKGTTAHTIASVLQEAGYKTGLYTSPHLKSFTERIRINGNEIEEEFVVTFIENIKNDIIKISPSFFEMTVALAFDYFAKNEVDIAVIETGLGGRLDSTNVLNPELSVITNISLDHQEMLGDTIQEIAAEKAGIIKEGVPAVLGIMPEEAWKVILDKTILTNSNANTNSGQYRITKNGDNSFDVYYNEEVLFERLVSSVNGSYMAKNIPHILESINELRSKGYKIHDDMIRDGFENVVSNTSLKGRWQIIDKEPLMICDVAHNIDGISQILSQLDEMGYRKLHFVFGTVMDKALDDILSILPKNAKYYFCEANVPRALNVEQLSKMAGAFDLKGGTFSSVNEAIESAKINAEKEDLIFIGGSTFVVAEIEDL